MIYGGIDWGTSGAIAFIDDSRKLIKFPEEKLFDYDDKYFLRKRKDSLMEMPTINGKEYDIKTIFKILEFFKSKAEMTKQDFKVFVEDVHWNPVMSNKACLSSGYNNGVIIGMLVGLRIPFEVVLAKNWQKIVFKNIVAGDTKTASIIYCQNSYPDVDFRRSPKCKTSDVGLTDALCIANYCWIMQNKQI